MGNDNSLNLYRVYAEHFPSPQTVLLTTDDDVSYTYADAERCSAQIANYLLARGLQPGDRVSAQVEKSPQALWLYLATIRAGLIFHPLNPAYTDAELRYFLQDAGSAMLVCDSARSAAMQALCAELGNVQVCLLDADGSGSLVEGALRCSTDFDTVHSEGNDLAALVYSSGTTGRPKGIMLTHKNLVENITVLSRHWGFAADDCLLHALPVFHVHGLFVAVGCVLMSGSRMRWLSGFHADVVCNHLPFSTVMMGVPTYYTRLLAHSGFGAPSCKRMRLFISGSAPLLAETFMAFQQCTGHTILERYGMTETGMNTSNPLQGDRRAGTVGLALPGVTLRVCDAKQQTLPAGAVGDLQVKGANVFAGYWNMPEQTAADFTADGFFKTGDQASIDAQGYISIVGRSKDMVISGGLNIYPKEIELLINALPGVQEAAVIGLADADFGEIAVAVVATGTGVGCTENAVRDALRGHLASFKIPKKVFFVQHLPKNAMGKVQKNKLRARYGKQ